MSSFKDLRIVDNFYQTSSYYPMPTVMISTLAEDGSTSVGSYSLCFPYYIAGKSYYAMVLEARNSSNTAQHLLAGRRQVALNFMPEGPRLSQEDRRSGLARRHPGREDEGLRLPPAYRPTSSWPRRPA